MDQYSNIDEVIASLDAIVDGFGFDLTTGDQDLGQDCVTIFAGGVQDLAAQGIGSEGEWKANSDEPEGHGYASYKARVYGVVERPNVRTNQMLSELSLSNSTRSHETVDLKYGTGMPPGGIAGGQSVQEADKKITDREKAYYAHTGQGPEGIRRPFYALNDDINTGIQVRCQERLNDYAEEVWSA